MINPNYVDAIIEVAKRENDVNRNNNLPPLANKIIEFGKENGAELEIKYTTQKTEDGLVAGYNIIAPEYSKAFFMQDIYIDDDSEENTQKALDCMSKMIQKLKEIQP